MNTAASSSGAVLTVVCAHLDSVERRLLARPSMDEIQEIQVELDLAISLVRGLQVPAKEPGVVEETFRPIQVRLRRLSALLEHALSFCDGWQTMMRTESGYNLAGVWNSLPSGPGLLDHRG